MVKLQPRELMNRSILDYWAYSNCGTEFTNPADCANERLLLCVYCEDERMQAEGGTDVPYLNESHR